MSVDEIIERIARDPGQPLRVPRATYRLQLGPGLTFDDAAEVAEYLAALGISDAYTSPFFETSGAGSHGYDVADHGTVSRARATRGGATSSSTGRPRRGRRPSTSTGARSSAS